MAFSEDDQVSRPEELLKGQGRDTYWNARSIIKAVDVFTW